MADGKLYPTHSSNGEERFKSLIFHEVRQRESRDPAQKQRCRPRFIVVVLAVIAPLFIASLITTTFTNQFAIETLSKEFSNSRESFVASMRLANKNFAVALSKGEADSERNFAAQADIMATAITGLISFSSAAFSSSIQESIASQSDVIKSIRNLEANSTETATSVSNSTRELIDKLVPTFHRAVSEGIAAAVFKVLERPIQSGEGYANLYRLRPFLPFDSIDERVWAEHFNEFWLDIATNPSMLFTGIMGPSHAPNSTKDTPWAECGFTRIGVFYAVNYNTKSTYEFFPLPGLRLENRSNVPLGPYFIDSRDYSDNCPNGIAAYAKHLTVYTMICYSANIPGSLPEDPFQFGFSTILYQKPLFQEEMYREGKDPVTLPRDSQGRLINGSSGTVESCRSFELSTGVVNGILRDYLKGSNGTFAIILGENLEIIAGSGLRAADMFVTTSYTPGTRNALNATFGEIAAFCSGQKKNENLEIEVWGSATAQSAVLDTQHANANVARMARLLLANSTRLQEDEVSWIASLEEDFLVSCHLLQLRGLRWNLCISTPLSEYTASYREAVLLGSRIRNLTENIVASFAAYAQQTNTTLQAQLGALESSSRVTTAAIGVVKGNITESISRSNSIMARNAEELLRGEVALIDDFTRHSQAVQQSAKKGSLRGVWVNFGVFALMLIGCVAVISSFVRPLFRLQALMRSVANMELDSVQQPSSYINELYDMYTSFTTMVRCMQVYKSYLPQGLFDDPQPEDERVQDEAGDKDQGSAKDSRSSVTTEDQWQLNGAHRPKLSNGVIIVAKIPATLSMGMGGEETFKLTDGMSKAVDSIVAACARAKILCVCGDRVVIFLQSIGTLQDVLDNLLSINGITVGCSRSPLLVSTLGSGSFRAINAFGPALSLAHSLINIGVSTGARCVVSESIYSYLQYSTLLVPFGQLITRDQSPTLVYELVHVAKKDAHYDREWMYNVDDVNHANMQFESIMNSILGGQYREAEAALPEAGHCAAVRVLRAVCAARAPYRVYQNGRPLAIGSTADEVLELD